MMMMMMMQQMMRDDLVKCWRAFVPPPPPHQDAHLPIHRFKDGIDEFRTWTSWGIGSSESRPGPPDQIATEFFWICKGTDDSISDQPRSHGIKWLWTIREFALLSRAEALIYGEQCLKFQVKKRNECSRDDDFHATLESSTIVPALRDLKISQGDQVLLYMRNLPSKAQDIFSCIRMSER